MNPLNPYADAITSIPGLAMNSDAVEVIPVNGYSMLTVPAYFRAVRFLSENLARFSRSVVRDGVEVEGNPHPLRNLLRLRPNAYQTPFVFWRTWYFSAVHRGNGLARIERNPVTRQPQALHNLNPDDVLPFRIDRKDGRGPQGWYAVFAADGRRLIPAEDVLALIGVSYDGLAGMEPAQMHRQTMEFASTIDRFYTKYLRKGTQIKGAVEIDGHVEDDDLDDLKSYLRSNFRGIGAHDDILILTDGAKLKNTTIKPEESQLSQQGKTATQQVAQITGVPPQFLYEFSDAKYNNAIEAMGQDVVRYTFGPWIVQAQEELSLKLLSDPDLLGGYSVNLNAGVLLQGDTKVQSENVRAEVAGGLRTRNEGRRLLGLPPTGNPADDQLRQAGDTTPAQNPNAPPSNPPPPA